MSGISKTKDEWIELGRVPVDTSRLCLHDPCTGTDQGVAVELGMDGLYDVAMLREDDGTVVIVVSLAPFDD